MQRLKQPKMNVNSLKKKLILYEQILDWLEVILKSTEKKKEVKNSYEWLLVENFDSKLDQFGAFLLLAFWLTRCPFSTFLLTL